MGLHCVEVEGGRAEMCLKIWKSLVAGEGHFNICDISQVSPWWMPLVHTAQQWVVS